MRTRLHRARTALRAQLEQMLEESLTDLQPSKNFTRSVLVLLPMSPKGAIGAGGVLAVLGKLFAGLSFALWISLASILPILGLFTMFSKLDEASLEDKPENQPIKTFIRGRYKLLVAAMIFSGFWAAGVLLLRRHFHFDLRLLLQISSIAYAYMTWRAFKLLRVNTSTAVIGGAAVNAVFFIVVVSMAFFRAWNLLFLAAIVLTFIIVHFTTKKMPQRFGFNLFTGSAMGIFGDFEDNQSLRRRLTRTELLSFAKFLGGLWLVQDYKWRADGITLLIPAMPIWTLPGATPPIVTAGSKMAITWDGDCTAMMSAKDMKVTRQLLVGRSVEAAELQDNARRVVRFALNCFLRGDLEAARKVLSPDGTFAKSPTGVRHNRAKSLAGVLLGIAWLGFWLLVPSAKDLKLHHRAGAYYGLIVMAAGVLLAMLVMAITLRNTRRKTARSDEEEEKNAEHRTNG